MISTYLFWALSAPLAACAVGASKPPLSGPESAGPVCAGAPAVCAVPLAVINRALVDEECELVEVLDDDEAELADAMLSAG